MPKPFLQCSNLSFGYGEGPSLFADLSFSIEKEEIVALAGRSGEGKSTLFYILAGQLNPIQGEICLLGKPLKEALSAISIMTHKDLLLPWRTSLQNLLLPEDLSDKKQEGIEEKARDILVQMGLKQAIDAYPDQLSAGMRQRVALARTFLQKKPLILLDEPFASLDIITRQEMYEWVRSFAKTNKQTVLLISHDYRDFVSFSDRSLFLKDKQVHEVKIKDQADLELLAKQKA